MFRVVAFGFVLAILIAGILGSHAIVSELSQSGHTKASPRIALPPATATSAVTVGPTVEVQRRAVTPVRHAVHRRQRKTGRAPGRVSTPPTVSPVAGIAGTVAPAAPPVPAEGVAGYGSYQSGGPQPQPTYLTGVITLPNYWLGSDRTRPGRTLTVDYVIDNATGAAANLMLGASIKLADTIGWSSGVVNDPTQDVVAVVPPGQSIHVRYFTVPARLAPGLYDMAWGLRDAQTGRAVAFVSAPVLRIIR